MSQPPRLVPDSFDEFASLSQQHFFCGVIWLPKLVRESFDELHALARKHARSALLHANRHHRGPPRMYAKAKSRLLHLAPILPYIWQVLLRDSAAIVSAKHPRSEEHTSELQSQSNLVCRLLLEKKKNK